MMKLSQRLFWPALFCLWRVFCPRLFSLCPWPRLFCLWPKSLFSPPVSWLLFSRRLFSPELFWLWPLFWQPRLSWCLWPLSLCLWRRLFSRLLLFSRRPWLFLTAVGAEGAGRRELAELVSDHRLRDEDRDVLLAVVDGDRVPDHLREDRRGARPGFHHLFFAGLVHGSDPPHQALLDPRALFRRSTHGPRSPALLLAATTAADDVAVGLLALLAGAVAERRFAPRGDRVTAGGVVRLAAAVRVVDRVHRDAAGLRALALVAAAAGLPHLEILVLGVGEDADGGATVGANQPHLRGGQAQGDHLPLLRDQLDRGAGGAAELATLAGDQLDVVDDRAGRHLAQRHRVAGFDVGLGARVDHVADFQRRRGEDVALGAVGVVEQGDVAGAVGVVLDR